MNDFNPAAFSNAVADVAERAAPATASLATHHRTASAFHWGNGLFVAAEETVEPDEAVELTLASGATVKADLLGRDKPGVLENTHVLLHAGERHVEPIGELGDRGLRPAELLKHPAPRRVRQCRERGVESRLLILNHLVQYQTTPHLFTQCSGPRDLESASYR